MLVARNKIRQKSRKDGEKYPKHQFLSIRQGPKITENGGALETLFEAAEAEDPTSAVGGSIAHRGRGDADATSIASAIAPVAHRGRGDADATSIASAITPAS